MLSRRSCLRALLALSALAACRSKLAFPPGLFPANAAGGWRRVSLRDLPVSESPDPVPRFAVDGLLAASYGGPGDLDARVYAISSAGEASALAARWHPSSDTVFFNRGRFFAVVKWRSADRKLLREFLVDFERRLAGAKGGQP